MPPEIQKLADRFLQNPERIEVAKPASAAKNITQRFVASHGKDYEKRAALRDLVRAQDDLKNAIIFCNRKKDVADLFRSPRTPWLFRRRAARRHGPALAHDYASKLP